MTVTEHLEKVNIDKLVPYAETHTPNHCKEQSLQLYPLLIIQYLGS